MDEGTVTNVASTASELAELERRLQTSLASVQELLAGYQDRRRDRSLEVGDLFDRVPEALLVTDGLGRVLAANRAAERQFEGCDLVGASLGRLVDATHREAYERRVAALVEGRAERIQDWHVVLRPESGVPFHAELTVEPERSMTGRARRLHWSIRDVTERRLATEALRDGMARLQAVLDSAVDGIITVDDEGLIESLNPAAQSMFGREATALLGTPFLDLFAEESRARLSERLGAGEVGRTGSPPAAEGRGGDGARFPVEVLFRPVVYSGGRRRVVATLRDLSEREKAAAAVRHERDFAETLLDTAQAVILVLDPEGRIIRYNRYLEVVSGVPLSEVAGESWFDHFLPAEDRQEIRGVFGQAMAGDGVDGYTNAILTRERGRREIEWHATVLRSPGGEAIALLSVGHDITERRRLEAEFRQAQKMEAVGRLAGGVAHDFNTLLGSITGYSELLVERLAEESPLRRHAAQIRRAADRGAALTRQLLAFSRRQNVRPEVLSLAEVVHGLEEMLTRLIGEDVEIAIEAEPGLGLVRADASQLEQVVLNLAINAGDAMPYGGRIAIRLTNVEHSCGACDRCEVPKLEYVQLTVEDTGIGMDAEVRRRVFEPFFTTKEPGKGTGLGLATVYGIVRQWDGCVSVESELGQGARFRVCLPRVPSDLAAGALPIADGEPAERLGLSRPRATESILLVEDDEMFRELLAEVLAAAGYRVLAASGADEALALVEEHPSPIDLLLTDLVMPGLSGFELAARLTRQCDDLRVVFMSGYSDEVLSSRDPGDLDGAIFVQKPFRTDRLLATLRRALEEERPPSNAPGSA